MVVKTQKDSLEQQIALAITTTDRSNFGEYYKELKVRLNV